MGMVLSAHQLSRAFTDPLRDPAAQVAPMVQEKLEQVQIRATELAAQREVIAQPRIRVFDQGAATWRLRHSQRHGVNDCQEFGSHPGAQPVPALPVRGWGARLAVQYTHGTHEMFRQFVNACDRRQLVVEYTGEREQVVALVLQRNAHRPNAAAIVGRAPAKLGDDEVEQI